MTTVAAETLPDAVAAALSDEQRQSVLESPREKRVEVLASALGRPEPEILARLATAAGLERSGSGSETPA